MTYCVIRDADFRVVKQSSNLRGIIEYSRRAPVKTVMLFHAAPALGVIWGGMARRPLFDSPTLL